MLVCALSVSSACNDEFLDINTDPNFPAEASADLLTSAAQAQYAFAFAGTLSRITSTLTKQIVNTRYDRWDIGRTDIGNSWRFELFGGALKDLEQIIDQSSASEDWKYVGISKLQKAYIYSIMVDLFGDLPYTQFATTPYPQYEDDAEVYDLVLLLIDEAIADLDRDTAPTEFVPGADDYIYKGDIGKWRKMANSLKLKMYLQISRVDEARARAAINTLAGAPQTLITEPAANFSFPFFNSASPENRHPNYVADYPKTGRENYMSQTFYDLLVALDDPRLPYYIENQLASDQFEGLTPGVDTDLGNDDNTRSVWGVYPVGGRFGGTGKVNGESGTGAAPLRMITSYMVHFMMAEAELVLNDDPAAAAVAFEKGMQDAFFEVNKIDQVPPIDQALQSTYIQDRMAAFTAAADAEAKLDVVITQKYLANFGNGIEAYTDFRRTGYPSFPDIDDIQDPLGEGVFPRRLPYDVDEFQGPNPPPDDILLQTPVFWDVPRN